MAFNKTSRLQKEMQRLQTRIQEAGGTEKFLERDRWVLEPTSSLEVYNGTILGAVDTPYENQRYPLTISVEGVNYPHLPPKVVFSSVIPFHPNVFTNGNICIDILKSDLSISRWAPVMKFEDVMASLVSLLNDPNTDSPANVDASKAFDQDQDKNKPNFAKMARQHYEKQLQKKN